MPLSRNLKEIEPILELGNWFFGTVGKMAGIIIIIIGYHKMESFVFLANYKSLFWVTWKIVTWN